MTKAPEPPGAGEPERDGEADAIMEPRPSTGEIQAAGRVMLAFIGALGPAPEREARP